MKSSKGVLPHVVIVGAGFGGLRAARALRNARVQVTVIDRRNHHLFQPLLYQVATAGLSPAQIAYPIRSVLRNQKNTEVLMDEVVGIDVTRSCVMTHERSVFFDYLILATGARHSYFGRDEWEQFAPGLKSIENATDIRRRILISFEKAEVEQDPELGQAWLSFVIVGGGPTGVELAGSIVELAHVVVAKDFRHINPRAARIVLVEAGPRVLSTFPEDLAAKARGSLERLGVEVRTGARVENVTGDGVYIDGKLLPAKTVIWAAGVVASPAAKWLGAEADRAGRTKVTRDLSVAGHPNIFVIGDTAAAEDEHGKPLPGVAPVAMQQGRYVAKAIARKIAGKAGLKPFHYLDKGSLATVGRAFAVVEMGRLHLAGFFAWLTWIVVHIFYLIGFRNRVLVMLEWWWAYLTFQRGARLITEDSASMHQKEIHHDVEKTRSIV